MEEYKEIFHATEAVIAIYNRLTLLEQKNQQDTPEYRECILFLEHMVSIENRKYQSLVTKPTNIIRHYKIDCDQSKNNYFIELRKKNIEMIRIFNHLDDCYVYTLDGVVPRGNIQWLQENLDVTFFIELNRYLKYGKMTKEERDTIIEFKYGLLASSQYLEQNFLSGELFLPFTNIGMSEQQLKEATTYIYRKVKELIAYLLCLNDESIDEQTLPIILYVKSCFGMLPPFLLEQILLEIGAILRCEHDENKHKITSMMAYLIESDTSFVISKK